MQKYLLLSQSAVGANMLAAWTRLLALPNRKAMVATPIIIDERLHSAKGSYGYVVRQIESGLDGRSDGSVTVLVDAIRPEELSIVRESAPWDNLVAMLVITFPEFNWFFAFDGLTKDSVRSIPDRRKFPTEAEVDSNPELGNKIKEIIFGAHERYSVFREFNEPLLDPTGLREWIRWRTNNDLRRMAEEAARKNGEQLAYDPFTVPRRRELAAVIEDETDYALMHGYAAYRFGFRTEVVTSLQQMEARFRREEFNGKEEIEGKRHPYRLILEDMRLQFADKQADIRLSKPEDRARHCNLLADENDDSDFRFMISTGQEATVDDLWATNKWHLDNKRCGFGKLLMKPVGGPLALWRETDLRNQLHDGQAHGFVSPPAEIMDDLYDGHGAPGKLALVASTMIDRARRVLASADTPREYLLAAVLAGDAFELLGGKTPTMSLDAIKLKHVSEVRAECAFIGAGFHADLTDRFNEIHRDVGSVGRWYHPKQRKQAELDAKTTIYNELVKVYRDVGQMEEENQCLMQFRSMNRKLERPKGFWRFNPFSWSLHVIVSYGEWLMGRFWRIAFASVVWLFAFVLFAWQMDGQENFAKHLARQLNWMSGGTNEDTLFLAWLSSAANVVGVFHFGILVSYLYSLISRK